MATTAKSLAAHDKRFHGGHYEGGACKYREERGIPTAPANGDSDSADAPSAAEQYLEAVEKDKKGKKPRQLFGTYTEPTEKNIKRLLKLLPKDLAYDEEANIGTADLMMALDNSLIEEILDSCDEIIHTDRVYYCDTGMRGTKKVNLSKTFNSMSIEKQSEMLLHEFGHLILRNRKIECDDKLNDAQTKVLDAMESDARMFLQEFFGKDFERFANEKNDKETIRQMMQIMNEWSADTKYNCNWNKKIESVLEDELEQYNEEECKVIIHAINDMVNAATKGYFGKGHGFRYFSIDGRRFHEFFANLCAMKGEYEDILNKVFPNASKAMISVVNK